MSGSSLYLTLSRSETTMTNRSQLAAQITAYSQAHPAIMRTLWACALHHIDADGLNALGARLGGDTMGDSLRAQLRTLAMERRTTAPALTPK